MKTDECKLRGRFSPICEKTNDFESYLQQAYIKLTKIIVLYN